MFDCTFSPIKLGGITLKNRLLTSAMEAVLCDDNGYVTDRYIDYLEARASGGFGLIVTGMITVNRQGHAFNNCAANWDDSYIDGFRRIAERIHKHEGAKICMQIGHCGRQGRSRISGLQPAAASGFKDPTMSDTPHELTVDEIHKIVDDFGKAALRAKIADFDAVEIHAAHGYLVHGFFSPFSNKRTDEYGGNLHNRARIAVEIIRKIKELCGKDFPIIVKISTTEVEGSRLSIADTKAISMMLEEAGADSINATMGAYATKGFYPIVPPAVPHAFSANLAEEIKEVVSIPVVSSGRYNEPYIIEAMLKSKKADLISLGRQSLADPDFPNKMQNGQLDDIMHCVGCMLGCSGHLKAKNWDSIPITCLVNPRTGNEAEFDFSKKAEHVKKVAVAGGGVGGMSAAITAAKRGHKVALYEGSDHLGGRFCEAAVPPSKQERTTLIIWQKRQLELLGVEVHLNTAFTGAIQEQEKYDVVVDATGATPVIPNIPGARDTSTVTTAVNILNGTTIPGKKAVVVGGGQVGAEAAAFLAENYVDVSLIEMTGAIAADAFANAAYWLMEDLKKNNVKIYTDSTVKMIEPNAVIYEHNNQVTKIDGADTIVIAVGSKSNTKVADELKGKAEILTVGDASRARDALCANLEGYRAGFAI